MLYRIGYDRWNPFEGTSERQFIELEATGGDDAAAKAQVAIRATVGERTGIKIVQIEPAPVVEEAPAEPEPVADAPRRGRPPKANAAIEGGEA